MRAASLLLLLAAVAGEVAKAADLHLNIIGNEIVDQLLQLATFSDDPNPAVTRILFTGGLVGCCRLPWFSLHLASVRHGHRSCCYSVLCQSAIAAGAALPAAHAPAAALPTPIRSWVADATGFFHRTLVASVGDKMDMTPQGYVTCRLLNFFVVFSPSAFLPWVDVGAENDMKARAYVKQLMTEAGLAIREDTMGSIYG